MSFTTRCPACGTTFRIVPDQLKISDGWVRCGHCSDVFDATLFLEGERVAAAEVPAAAPPPPAPSHEDGDWLLHPDQLPVEPAPEVPPEAANGAFADELRQFAAQAQEEAVSPEEPAGEVAAASAPSDKMVADEKGEPPAQMPAPPPASDGPGEADDGMVPTEPSFVRQARRKAFWQSRGMRVSLVAMTLLLLAGLLSQWAVHERDRLAARYPFAAPLLAAICQPLGCRIGPARQIESVAIDSSNLVRRLGNFYSFDLVLKNSAPLPVAVPALELSLTDTRDNVIVRRVFLPEELPGSPQVLPAQGAVSMSLRLSIADSGVSSMTGYRALVFYP